MVGLKFPHRVVRKATKALLQGLAPPKPRPAKPGAGRFLTGNFSGQNGNRTYKLYVPATHHGRKMPLVVMLHGCTQSPDDFAAGTRMNEIAEECGFLVAYPAQSVMANPSRCWNWFNDGDQHRDHGEPSLIAGITRQIMETYPVDPARIFVAGLSAGGAEAAILGQAYPELYAAIGVHSGLACGAARDMASAFSAMRQGGTVRRHAGPARPTIMFHGDHDTTVSPINGEQVIEQALGGHALKPETTDGISAGGVAFTRTIYREAGRALIERWVLHGVSHAWSGGSAAGSYTAPKGPDASREMVRFFLDA